MSQKFSQRFADAWKNPTPDALVALLDPDVVLLQPHRSAVVGKAAALEEFQRLFAWLPGLYGSVDRAVEEGGWVFIEWRMQFRVGGTLISIPAVDRFRVSDGLGVERIVYFDQLALIAALSKHPTLWLGYLRYKFASL